MNQSPNSKGFILFTLFALIASFNVSAEITVPDSVRDQIVTDVMTEQGYYDAAEIEQRIRLWQLEQPQPRASGELTETGTCNSTCEQTGGDVNFLMPRNVKFKGKIVDDKFTQNLIIKWKRPQSLPDGSNYKLKNYKIILSKDGTTFEKYKVKPKFKNNGNPKKHQKLKLRGLEEGDYEVQVKATYKSLNNNTTAAKSGVSSAGANRTNGITASSPWTDTKGGSSKKGIETVGDVQNESANLYACLTSAPYNYLDTKEVDTITSLVCLNAGLTNSDLTALNSLTALTYLRIGDNPLITNLSSLNDLILLEYLGLQRNGLDFATYPKQLLVFDSLETLIIKELGLVVIPEFPDSVDYINLDFNAIVDNAGGYFPQHKMDTLRINKNMPNYPNGDSDDWSVNDAFFTNLATNNVVVGNLTARYSHISDIGVAAGVHGVSYLDLGYSYHMTGNQDLNDFGGLCLLNLERSKLSSLDTIRPIQNLHLEKTWFLQDADVLDTATAYWPHTINYNEWTGRSCSSNDTLVQKNATSAPPTLKDISTAFPLIVNGVSRTVPSCPVINTPSTFIPTQKCKPDSPLEANVYEDVNSSRRVVTWEMDPAHDIDGWGITHYKVRSHDGNQTLQSFLIDADAEKSVTTFSLTPTKYLIQACTEHRCGSSKVVHDTSFKQGLARPIDAVSVWDTTGSTKTFQFRFKYPNYAFDSTDGFGKPDKFVITPNFGQPDSIIPVEVLVSDPNTNGNCGGANPCDGDTERWYSSSIAQDAYIGKDFSIKACRDDIGCGPHLNVRLGDFVVSADLPIPAWNGALNQVVGLDTFFNLQWNSSVWNDADVDYIEVEETQPIINALDPIRTVLSDQIITYYYENTSSEKLERLVRGDYKFRIKSCKRNRELGDICSAFSPTKTVELLRNDVPDSMVVNPTTFEFIDLTVTPGVVKPTLVWNEPAIKPDYYRFSYAQLGSCGGYGAHAQVIENAAINKLEVSINGNSPVTMNTLYWSCPVLPSGGNPDEPVPIQISSCFKGIGCHESSEEIYLPEPMNTSGTATLDSDLVIPNTSNPNQAGGPGDMRPGVWWNPQLSGTGWHFYWASELRYPSVHENYGETYDLIGVWLMYQKINDVWSPTWLMSHLKTVEDGAADEGCLDVENPNANFFDCAQYFEGDLSYITRPGGVVESKSLGRLQVFFEAGDGLDSNISALLKIDLDSENGMLTAHSPISQIATECDNSVTPVNDCLWIDDNGNLNMPLSNFDQSILGNPSVGDDDNDINHYSGMWSPNHADGSVDSSFAYMVDIINNLEWSALLLYDAAGIPLWGLSDTCEGNPSCQRTNDGEHLMTYKTIKQGFDPLLYTPRDFWIKENNFADLGVVNSSGRIFKDQDVEDFNEMKFWANLNNSQLPGRAGISLTSGSSNSPTVLSKQASFHDIRFFINGGYEAQTVCDPNEPENEGQCSIRFAWFTDDDFPVIRPYYRKDGGSLIPLDELCGLPISLDHYVETEYVCDIYQPGEYVFELRKPSYLSDNSQTPEQRIQIAISDTLEIMPCTSENCEANTYTPLPEVTSSESPYIGPDADTGGNGDGDGVLEWSDLPDAPVSSSNVGATKGEFKVTPGGAASYTIPILTAPASGGLQPQLAMSYNSQGSRGSMGMGWGISGYSVVSRCAQTFEQDYDENSNDPLIQSVTFTDSDRFCVDGQRLMLADSTATYGANNTVYYTEIFNGTKYISIGTQGSGPQCFEAWHKNGSVTLYGDCKADTSDDSASVESGLPDNSALMWAQSRMTDDKGNYYTHQYLTGVIPNGSFDEYVEFHLDEVKFSANENVSGSTLNGTVKMIYQNMPSDQINSSVISTNPLVKTFNNRRLIGVQSKYNNTDVRYYKLNYFDSDTAQIDVLTSIQECSSAVVGASCFDATTFDWGNTESNSIGATATSPAMSFSTMPLNNAGYSVTQMDANGDGLQDFHYYASYYDEVSQTTQVQSNLVYLSNGDGSFSPIPAPNYTVNKQVSRVDINADGYTDFVVDKQVYLWNGSGYESGAGIVDLNILDGFNSIHYNDFNGDGLVDVLAIERDSNGEWFIVFFENRLDLTITPPQPGGDLTQAFQTPVWYQVNYSGQFLSQYAQNMDEGDFPYPLEELPPEIIKIENVIDTNGDGVSELLLELDVDFCFDSTGDVIPCEISPASTSSWVIAVLGSNNEIDLNYLTGTLSCQACSAKSSSPQMIDLTNDGTPEVCYFHKSSTQLEGEDFLCRQVDEELSLRYSANISFEINNMRNHKMIDYNGDGLIDILYSTSNNQIASWKLNLASWNNGVLTYSDTWTDLPILAGNQDANDNDSGNFRRYKKDKNLFIDINNDGLTDHIVFQAHANTRQVQSFASIGQNPEFNVRNKDKVKTITNGLGDSWQVEYGSMTDQIVYTRENNSVNAWYGSGRSPVYDFISPITLVTSVKHSMPAWEVLNAELNHGAISLPNSQAETKYHYKNAKLQAGGRGFLGFGEFSVFDTTNNILTRSEQSQDFPFIGSVKKTKTWWVPDPNNRLNVETVPKDLTKPCWVDNNCEPEVLNIDICIPELGNSCPVILGVVDTTYATQLKEETNNWFRKILTNTNSRVYFPYVGSNEVRNYELNGGEHIGGKYTINTYGETDANFWGNQTKTDTYILQGGTSIKRTITDLVYDYFNQGSGVITRLKNLTVENQLGGLSETRITDYTYDANHLLYSETASSPGDSRTRIKTIASRNSYGLPKLETISGFDAQDSSSKTIYDGLGRVPVESKTEINSSFVTTNEVIQYNALGLPEVVENAIGIKTFNKYDRMGRLFYTISETGTFTKTTYHNGFSTECSSSTGTAYYSYQQSQVGGRHITPDVWTCYDLLGREVRTVTSGFGPGQKVYVDTQYDTSGRLLAQSVPLYTKPSADVPNHWVRTAYDEIGRPLLKREPYSQGSTGGPTAALTYYTNSFDAVENKSKLVVANALGHTTTTYTNALGQITKVTDAGGASVTYQYNAMGKQTEVDGPLAGDVDKIITTYDAFDQVQTIDDPDLGLWYYKYNVLGQLDYQVDAKFNCTKMEYDELGRTEEKFYYTNASTSCSGGGLEDYHEYTFGNNPALSSFGQLLSEKSNDNEKIYTYDAFGRSSSISTEMVGFNLIRTEETFYDSYGRVHAAYDASGMGTLYHYNDQGYQASMQGIRTGITYQTILAKDAFGNNSKELAGNGIYTNRFYDESGRMELLMSGSSDGGSELLYMQYEHDAVGNILQRIDSREIGFTLFQTEVIENFEYDDVNRLLKVETTYKDDVGNVYSMTDYDIEYDAGGRRSSLKHLNETTINYTYDPNHIHGVSNTTDGKFYQYDATGNQTLSDGRTLEYTAFNKASRMSNGSFTVEYSYGASNEKVIRKDISAGEEKLTWYVGNAEIITEGWSGGAPASIKEKRYLGDNVVVTHNGPDNIDIDYIHKDHLGSIQLSSKQGVDVVTHLSYDAFGKRRAVHQPTFIFNFNRIAGVTNKGFTGQDHVDELSLINFKARMYDPNLGMMLQADTVVPDGQVVDSLNRYAYVYNNPLSYNDPTGHFPGYHYNALGGNHQNLYFNPTQALQIAGDQKAMQQSDFAKFMSKANGNNGQPVVAGVQTSATGNGNVSQNTNASQSTKTSTNSNKPKGKDYSNDENALKNIDLEEHLGNNKYVETKIFVAGPTEEVLDTSQAGCYGNDRCEIDPKEVPKGTTMIIHNHLEPNLVQSKGAKSQNDKALTLSRDVAGQGDHNPLKIRLTSGVITPGGYRFHITGASKNPKIKYVSGGDDPAFGRYVEKHWKPNNEQLILDIAKDYLKVKK